MGPTGARAGASAEVAGKPEGMAVDTKYRELFSPFRIGKVQLKNRIVKTAAQTYFFESGEQRVGGIAKGFYGAVARGGAGLVITETPAMEWPLLEEGDRRFRIDDDKYLKQLEELSAVVHRHGVPIFTQLYHRGPWGGPYVLAAERVAASPVTFPNPFDPHEEEPPRALTIGEIEGLVDRFASGAARLQKAGWDGIEINAGADHLFHSFLSRYWNRRDDEYGPQSMENRSRFIVAVIKEIKNRCGEDFPVQILMNGIEIGIPEGLTIEEAKEIAKIYEAVGVNSLHVRAQWVAAHHGHESLFYPEPHIPLSEFPKELDWSRRGAGSQVPVAAIIKQTVSLPVMTVGLLDADLGEAILRESKADLIGFNRRIFADPDYPNKVRAGRFEDIQPCTHCGTCTKRYNEPRYCRINASFGKEQYELSPLGTKKRVLVVGGGPAGMQAARIAASRGHAVTLWDKGRYLGGATPLAAMVKGFDVEELPEFIKFLRTQVRKAGVDVKLGKEFKLVALDELKPDAVVLAVGGVPVLPDIPGIEGKNVIKTGDLYSLLRTMIRLVGPQNLRRLTKIWMPVGKRVVIIGGAIQGCQLAEFLVKRGREVTIVEPGSELGEWLVPERKARLFYWFDKKGVERLTDVKLIKVTKEGLTVEGKEGQTWLLDADNVIPVLPFASNTLLQDGISGRVPEVYAIGDCESPATIPEAMSAGWTVGNAL